MRIIDISGLRHFSGFRHCEIPGCKNTTREKKPYCSKHIWKLPYIQKVVQEILTQENEVDRVKRIGISAINPEGDMLQEVIIMLENHGSMTQEKLAQWLHIDYEAVVAYVKFLWKRNKVATKKTTRGSTVVSLINGHCAQGGDKK